MTFDVRFSDEAERNVREIRDWIKERSPAGAIKWFDALEHVKTRLTQSAENFGCQFRRKCLPEFRRRVGRLVSVDSGQLGSQN